MKPEAIDRVRVTCESVFGKEFSQKMFGTDFKKHVLVVATFNKMIEAQPVVLIDVIDIVIKWAAIKLLESSNTTFTAHLFEFFAALQELFARMEHQLWDHEAYIFLPMLCDKIGINNAILRQKAKELLSKVFDIYDHKKCVVLIMKFGVGAKNLKNVSESLETLATFVKDKGVDQLTEKDCQVIAKLADSGDKGVRETSLQLLSEIFKVVDDNIWRLVGNISLKVRGLMEGRFKQIGKIG